MEEHDIGRLRAVAAAVAGGHLKVYSDTDDLRSRTPCARRRRRRARAPPTRGRYLAVIVNSGSGSKVDYYATREVDYDVQLGGERRSDRHHRGADPQRFTDLGGTRLRDRAARATGEPGRQHRPRHDVVRAGLRSADGRAQRHPHRRPALRLGARASPGTRTSSRSPPERPARCACRPSWKTCGRATPRRARTA